MISVVGTTIDHNYYLLPLNYFEVLPLSLVFLRFLFNNGLCFFCDTAQNSTLKNCTQVFTCTVSMLSWWLGVADQPFVLVRTGRIGSEDTFRERRCTSRSMDGTEPEVDNQSFSNYD